MVDISTTPQGHYNSPQLSETCRGVQQLSLDKKNFANSAPNQSQLAERIKSFNRAPLWDVSSSGFNPSTLAEAGLHYEYDDSRNEGFYRCFRCSLKESTWPFNTDPLQQHFNKSKNCPFIRDVLDRRRAVQNPASVNIQRNNGPRDSVDGSGTANVISHTQQGQDNSAKNNLGSRLEADGVAENRTTRTAAPANSKSNYDTSKKQSATNNFNRDNRDVDKLRRSIRRLRNNCRNCKSGTIETLFLPCRHMVACETCSDKMINCMACNAEILGTAKVYFG